MEPFHSILFDLIRNLILTLELNNTLKLISYFTLQAIELVLLDIPMMQAALDGVVMELQDCALPNLRGIE